MATKLLALACLGRESHGNLSPRPHYPSMPKYPKGVSVQESSVEPAGSEAKAAVFSVMGMTCSACAGSVEKAIKRLPGIREAVIDVLNNKAQVLFYPSFVNVRQLNPSQSWVLYDFFFGFHFLQFVSEEIYFFRKIGIGKSFNFYLFRMCLVKFFVLDNKKLREKIRSIFGLGT